MANKIYAAISNSSSSELFDFVNDAFAHFTMAKSAKNGMYEDISAGDFAEYLMEMAADHVEHAKPQGVE